MEQKQIGVLIVDDSPEDRTSYRRMLAERPDRRYLVREAETGEQALEMIAKDPPDCVLLDFMLPDTDGLEFMSNLLLFHQARPVPVIMLTGQGSTSLAVEALKAGAQRYLIKGQIQRQQLQQAVDDAVEVLVLVQDLAKQRDETEEDDAGQAARNTELDLFASVVACHLKYPMASVKGYLELVRDSQNDSLNPEGQRFVTSSLLLTERMNELVNSVLDYARAGVRLCCRESVDCEAVFCEALENLQNAVSASRATITHDPLPAVQGAGGQLRRLFENLLSNALKYRRQEPPRIHVTAERQAADWVFSVSDNGAGIVAEDLHRLFDLFWRASGAKQTPGSGIGLATCKKIVEAHGGRIWAESTVGEGATFRFTVAANAAGEASTAR